MISILSFKLYNDNMIFKSASLLLFLNLPKVAFMLNKILRHFLISCPVTNSKLLCELLNFHLFTVSEI